jgi:molybdopterin-guanine dinucleotide biosynthesis protein
MMLLKHYICFDDKRHSTLDIIQSFEWDKHDYDLVIVEGFEYYEDAYEVVMSLNLILKTDIKCPAPPNWDSFKQQRKSN